jgi:hypothetical protein
VWPLKEMTFSRDASPPLSGGKNQRAGKSEIRSSETSVIIAATLCQIPQDGILESKNCL